MDNIEINEREDILAPQAINVYQPPTSSGDNNKPNIQSLGTEDVLKNYKMEGFYHALQLEHLRNIHIINHLNELLTKQKLEDESKKQEIALTYQGKIDRIQEHIQHIKNNIVREEIRKETFLLEISEFRSTKDNLTQRLEEVKQKQLGLKVFIAQEKRNIWDNWFNQRITEIRNEIDQLIEQSLSLPNKQEIFDPLDAKEKRAISQRIKQDWLDLKNRASAQLNTIEAQVNAFLSRGFSTGTIKYLYFIGAISSFLLGLFAVKLYENISFTNSPVNFLNLIINGAREIQDSLWEVAIKSTGSLTSSFNINDESLKPLASILFIIVCFVVLVLLLMITSYVAKRSREKLKESSKRKFVRLNNLNIELNDDSKLNYKAEFKSNDFYTFWVQLSPILFITGAIIILLTGLVLASGESEEYFNAILFQVIAASLIPLGGALVYFLYIIPPTIEDLHANHSKWLYHALINFRKTIIVVSILAAVVGVSVSILTKPGITDISIKIHNLSHSLVYLTLCLLTFLGGAWALGFATRLNSLFTTERSLRLEVIRLSHVSEKYEAHKPYQIEALFDRALENKLETFNQEIAELISIKNTVTKELAYDFIANNYTLYGLIKRNFDLVTNGRFMELLSWRFKRNTQNLLEKAGNNDRYSLSDALKILRLKHGKTWQWVQGQKSSLEERYLEEHMYYFSEYQKEREELQKSINKTEKSIKRIKAGNHKTITTINERIEALWKERNTKEGEIMATKKGWSDTNTMLEQQFTTKSIYLKEGFYLAIANLSKNQQ